MFSMVQEGIEVTITSDVIKNAPSEILSKSIIYNLVNVLHLNDLFGVDLIKDHNPKKSEAQKANEFYA